MLRTQLMIPKELKFKLTSLAHARGISMGELIRSMIETKLEEDKKRLNPVLILKKLARKAIKTGDKKITSENFRQHYGKDFY